MLKEVRSQAKGPSAAALKDRRQLTKAIVIDQDEVTALQEAREARDVKKSKNAARQQKLHSTAVSSTTTPVTPPRRGQKKVRISRKVTVDLISPEASSSEDAWDTTAENSLAEEEKSRSTSILRTPSHHQVL